MAQPEPDAGFERLPLTVRFEDRSSFTETYGFSGSTGLVLLEGQILRPADHPSDTAYLFMHPSSALSHLPMPTAMARAGLHVVCCGSRYLKNDTALIMEKVAIDLGAYVRHVREILGYRKVVLVGWSGGGSLSLFYQSQALAPTITLTPAGDPVDLTAAGLAPGDAIIFIAAHMSRARILSEWIDPSVGDELDPDTRDVSLDLYHPENPNRAPYTPDYVTRFRAAQLARIARVTGWVKETLGELRRRGGAEMERGFVVHRTMADPRFLDTSLDPNGRKPGWCYLGAPETVNVGPVGLARFSTLRAWLSQWSIEDSAADGPACAGRIDSPLLLIENGADDAVPASHTRSVFESAASPDKTMHTVDGATHYYKDQPEKMEIALGHILAWCRERGFAQ